MKITLVLLIPFFLIARPSEPFGKDSELIQPSPIQKKIKSLNPLFHVAKGAIKLHQNFISPAQGERSHFKPSSSEYTKQAIHKHGFVKGFLMGCDRLMRENEESWVYETKVIDERIWKFDPVK